MDLNLNEIFSEEWSKKPFWEKRDILNEFHLKGEMQFNQTTQNMEYDYNFEVGESVLCFEDKNIDDEGSGHKWFMSGNDTTKKLKSITINKFYNVLEIKNDNDLLIKIMGDTGRRTWVQANRFLIGLSVTKRLRQAKLDKIEELFKSEE